MKKVATVLLVEDEQTTARLLAKMLREDGFEVELALDGAQAIGRLTRDPVPDALVTDLRMPHVDGMAVARYARARKPDMPVFFVTGYPQLLKLDLLDPEATVHVKPIDYPELSRTLHAAEIE
jgi:two-component system response regulator MprA